LYVLECAMYESVTGVVLIVECFHRAVLDTDSQLRLIHMFGAVISGSQVNNTCLLSYH